MTEEDKQADPINPDNPLAISGDDVNELMSRDPETLTDNDVDKLASYLRQQRHKWQMEEQQKGAKGAKSGKKPTSQGGGKKKQQDAPSLEELGLDLDGVGGSGNDSKQ